MRRRRLKWKNVRLTVSKNVRSDIIFSLGHSLKTLTSITRLHTIILYIICACVLCLMCIITLFMYVFFMLLQL